MSGKEFGTITHGPTTHNNSPGIEHDERPMKRFRAKPDGAKECYEKVFKAAHTVQILERVSDRGAKHIDTAVEILTTAQSTRESRVYQTFLYDILRQLGPGFVVLCAATLGKQRVVQLNELDRAGLVSRVKENNAILYCPALESLAEDFLVPSLNDPRLAIRLAKGCKRARDEEKLGPDTSSDDLTNTGTAGRPPDQPDESVADLKLTDLLGFLQQYEPHCPDLQMVCPWGGIPLPSIHINLKSSIGLSAQVEFSYELGKLLIEYILASRAASAKVPH